MLKGLRKVLSKPARKGRAAGGSAHGDVSHRSTASSAAASELFPCELDVGGWGDASTHQQQQAPALQQQQQQAPDAPQPMMQQAQAPRRQQPPLSASVIQAHLAQQEQLARLAGQSDAEGSTHARREAAVAKRFANASLNPANTAYQVAALLSLSTLFEHKVRRHVAAGASSSGVSSTGGSSSSRVHPGRRQCQQLRAARRP